MSAVLLAASDGVRLIVNVCACNEQISTYILTYHLESHAEQGPTNSPNF